MFVFINVLTTKLHNVLSSLFPISCMIQWSELHLGQTEEEPYYLKRNPSTNVVNPFGSSQCFGSGNLIFEVMENGYIASVTIFSPYLNN